MKMKFNIKKGDVVKIENTWGKIYNYFVVKVSKKHEYIEAMPLIEEISENKIPLSLSLPFQLIKNVKQIDKLELLYLLGNENPKIKCALQKKLYNSNIKVEV